MRATLSFTLLFLLVSTCFVLGNPKKKNNKLKLKVGKEAKSPAFSEAEGKKEAKKRPTTDVDPKVAERNETVDKQTHQPNRTLESGRPPRYPLKPFSAEVTAHQDEIGGCKDHSAAKHICTRCADKCFAPEHEVFAYSYCRKSCGLCDIKTSQFHTYWRLRAGSQFDPTWMLTKVEWYANANQNISLVDNSSRAYASSSFPGFDAHYAMEDNLNTSWYPSGWGVHDNNDDWIAYEFKVAVRIQAVRMVLSSATYAPKKIFVEAADNKFGPFQTKWMIRNPNSILDQVYQYQQCPVLWKKLETDNGVWCYRVISKLRTWKEAEKTCELEGGKLASIISDDERNFIANVIRPCGFTWIGLSQTNHAYLWSDNLDGSKNCPARADYRNWKKGMTYSDVQKDLLNCVAIDEEGNWLSFHCSNKFYFLCKQELKPRVDPRPDLVVQNNPTEPEIPPLIFIYPNITVPVVNTLKLEPGVFPDENGNVEVEEEEAADVNELLYDQTVAHLKQEGIEPWEALANDPRIDEAQYMLELNRLAINAALNNSDSYKNETYADNTKEGSPEALKIQQKIEHKQEYQETTDQNQAASQGFENFNVQSSKALPVVGPPISAPVGTNGMGSMPNIIGGKPVYEPAQPSSNENLSQNAGPVAASMNKPSQSNIPALPSTVSQNEIHSNNNQTPGSLPPSADNQPTKPVQTLPQTNPSPPPIQPVPSINLPPTLPQQLPNQYPTQPVQSPTVQAGEKPKEPSTQSSNNNSKQSSQPSEQNKTNEQSSSDKDSSEKEEEESEESESDEENTDDKDNSDEEAPKPNQSQPQQATTSNAPQPSINQPHQATGGWNSPQSPAGMGASPNMISSPPSPPAPKEGDNDDDSEPSIGSPSDVKVNKKKKKKKPTKPGGDVNGEDGRLNQQTVKKPIDLKQEKDEESETVDESDTTIGGINKNKKAKPGSGRKKSKAKHQKRTKSAKMVKKDQQKKTTVEQTNDDIESGYGNDGSEDDLDDIFQTISDKL
ncbi:uncharacterized protein LOC100202087 isoform X2 [Hydra vulgaris]|nr:uncharacterized protein LOC100202087 isoform X2 [Hydra vulgaris]